MEITVNIDIKPGGSINPINPKSKGTTPVAILSSPTFDAPGSVDTSSLTFGHSGDEHSLAFCGIHNVDADGRMDLLCHFNTPSMAFQDGDTEGVLKGKTLDGANFHGTDSVKVVPK